MKNLKVTFKSLSADARFLTLSEGNLKLVPNAETRFLIWNLPSKITCPYATEHCKQFCYAVKAENNYPDCLPSRVRHLEESKKNDFTEKMIFTIEAHLNRPVYKKASKVVVRIHESGDFYNLEYMAKWYKIAKHFKHNKKVVFMAYTKSVEYVAILALSGSPKPKNMIIRFSIWDDTKPEQIETAKKYNLPTYSAVEEFTPEIKSKNRCLCRDCAKCGKCWKNIDSIICEIH